MKSKIILIFLSALLLFSCSNKSDLTCVQDFTSEPVMVGDTSLNSLSWEEKNRTEGLIWLKSHCYFAELWKPVLLWDIVLSWEKEWYSRKIWFSNFINTTKWSWRDFHIERSSYWFWIYWDNATIIKKELKESLSHSVLSEDWKEFFTYADYEKIQHAYRINYRRINFWVEDYISLVYSFYVFDEQKAKEIVEAINKDLKYDFYKDDVKYFKLLSNLVDKIKIKKPIFEEVNEVEAPIDMQENIQETDIIIDESK